RKLATNGGDLLLERLLVDRRRLGPRHAHLGGLGHRLAARIPPRLRHADEPGGELAAAGVALVVGPDRDRRQRAAVGAAGAECAQTSSSQLSYRRTGHMPARS